MTTAHRLWSKNTAGVISSVKTSISVESIGIGDQGPVNEVLYLPVSKKCPDPIVFALYLVAGGMSRPVHPATPKIFKAYVYASIEPIQRRV